MRAIGDLEYSRALVSHPHLTSFLSTSTMSTGQVFLPIDNTNPAIHYSGGWIDSTKSAAWNSSIEVTSNNGATASFSFTGTGVVVVGWSISGEEPGASGALSQYVLDGGSAMEYLAPLVDDNDVVFYGSGTVADGSHTLEITVINAGVGYVIDYLAYLPSPSQTTSSASYITTVFVTPSSAAQSSIQGSSSLPVGPIVGGVVGGVALLVAAALAFYFLYFRKRRGGRGFYYRHTSSEEEVVFDAEKSYGSNPAKASQADPSLTEALLSDPQPDTPAPYTDSQPSVGATPSATPTTHTYPRPRAAAATRGAGPRAHSSLRTTSATKRPRRRPHSERPPRRGGAHSLLSPCSSTQTRASVSAAQASPSRATRRCWRSLPSTRNRDVLGRWTGFVGVLMLGLFVLGRCCGSNSWISLSLSAACYTGHVTSYVPEGKSSTASSTPFSFPLAFLLLAFPGFCLLTFLGVVLGLQSGRNVIMFLAPIRQQTGIFTFLHPWSGARRHAFGKVTVVLYIYGKIDFLKCGITKVCSFWRRLNTGILYI
ncbi:hypothetical protein A0H81_01427 [Grifola frondosa]|uniref:Transmembrane protein n=1 Tax=Grifola frondosa TaxID=5627 RepID=A0A1C7LPB8_GRIFR|nr:hypothetical protein A0H81_14216 [Grifola frondosa]OBZ66012.1 hypothetical protein A0H81_14017 [Grifola frondosa]OBZ79124.1 hypothetical protein A0H81_01427 [Grifola frondosa]